MKVPDRREDGGVSISILVGHVEALAWLRKHPVSTCPSETLHSLTTLPQPAFFTFPHHTYFLGLPRRENCAPSRH